MNNVRALIWVEYNNSIVALSSMNLRAESTVEQSDSDSCAEANRLSESWQEISAPVF
jgi:hypothetical protein